MLNFFALFRIFIVSVRTRAVAILKGILVTFGVLVAIFFVTRGEIPYASELSFIEYSDDGTMTGSVIPASCDGDPHAPYSCSSPIVSNATISSGTVVPNGTQYTITTYATSYSGSLEDHFVMINYQGTNAGSYRGYVGWHSGATGFYSWADNYKSGTPIACSGQGYGAIYGGGYGQEYINLHSCNVSTSGSEGNKQYTTSFVVSFNTNFTSPLTSNTLSTFVYETADGVPKSAGWTAYNTFSVNPVPTLTSASISTSPIVPDGSTQYTITAVANDASAGTDIRDQMILINQAGSNAGSYRGYVAWSHDSTFPFFGGSSNYKGDTYVGCSGSGSATIYDGTGGGGYGYEHINIHACATGVVGNVRTTTFTVSFNSSFTTPTTNNNLSMYVQDLYGNQAGWTVGDYFSVTVPVDGVCSATINACSAGSFSDTADSSTQYLWSCNGSGGGDNASCSVNRPTSVSANTAQVFSYGQASTEISPITITDATSPVITAANDIRIKIATGTVNMRWDTTDTSASISGNGSGKVSTTVSYEGGGSVLVIPVNTNFSASETITVSGLSFTSFAGVNVATATLRMYLDGASDIVADDNGSVGTVAIGGTLAVANHSTGQVVDAFNQSTEIGEELFALKLTPAGEDISVEEITFNLQEVDGITTENITNATLYRDANSNRTYDGGDVEVGGDGTVSVSGPSGTITFSTPFDVTTVSDHVLTADITNLTGDDSLRVVLPTTNIVTQGETTAIAITGSGASASIQHRKAELGGGGSSSAIGSGGAPAGDGVQTGGEQGGGGGSIDSDSGDSLGNEPGFEPPSSTSGSWTSGSNAYGSDGSYTTAASSVTQTYGNFGFNVPTNNQITGIEVKLEASASTPAGTISVRLSWDNGTSDTSAVTTATLSATDGVYSLGGGSETWGRSWSASEFNNGNFVIEVVGNPSSNTVRIDAIQVRVYHQATGGGGGGGGAVFKESDKHFATVYLAVKDMWVNVFRRFFEWLFW